MTQWAYRPSDQEHEKILRFISRHEEYRSVASVIREGTMRLMYDHEPRPLYTELSGLISDLEDLKEKYMEFLLDYNEEAEDE